MSAGRDWDRDRRRKLAKVASRKPEKTPYTGPVVVDPLEPIIREAVAAKRENRFYRMPENLSVSQRMHVWRIAMNRYRSELATEGPIPA